MRMQRQRKASFKSRVESELEILNKNSGRITRFFTEDRHAEIIKGNNEYNEDREIWRKYSKERMKTVSVALVFCLHIGVDPPDPVSKPNPCAKLEGWIDPFSCNPVRALNAIAAAVQKSYERWQPRARYKVCTDPTTDDVKKLCTSMRRNASSERVLFHYNGHGVPRPTSNGEIWVFNKTFTQYIPLSLRELQNWVGYPAIYVWDCNSAGTIIKTFSLYADDNERLNDKVTDCFFRDYARKMIKVDVHVPNNVNGASGIGSETLRHKDCIQLAACSEGEKLPTNPLLPADIFTSCLTTPIQASILTYLIRSGRRSQFPENIIDLIPGNLSDRKTILGELNWIFTAITDTIAWNRLPKEVFQRLFRQDLLLASLFRSYILAEKIMMEHGCRTVSVPQLPKTSDHPLWESWDYTLDQTLSYLYNSLILPKQNFDFYAFPREHFGKDIIYAKSNFCGMKLYINVDEMMSNVVMEHQHNWFFVEQLTAFEVWLEYCADKENKPPQQLPIVLQVLLSQAHRLRALELLGRFLDLGQWAVIHALAVGVFPYVQKLLQSNTRELRPWLAFIWAKILAVDPSCQTELFKENGDDGPRYEIHNRPKVLSQVFSTSSRYFYFIQILNDPETTPQQKIVPAFILATLFHNNYQVAQENLTRRGYVNLCTELLSDPAAKNCRLLKLWVLIGLGRLWADYDTARWQAVRLNAHPKVQAELDDQHPDVRAAAVYALGCLIKNRSADNEHASFVDQELCDVLCNKCSLDGSCLVRVEVVVALQWYIIDFEKHFIKVLLAILSKLEIQLDKYEDDLMDEGVDIAAVMGKPNKAKPIVKPSEQFFQTLRPYTSLQRDATTLNIEDVKIHENFFVGATKAENDFRQRCNDQIRFLQSKNFLESNERVWLSMLLLSMDPHIKVASMARVMVRKIEEMAAEELKKTNIKLSERIKTKEDFLQVEREPVTSRSVSELTTIMPERPPQSSPPPDSVEYLSDGHEEMDRASSPASAENRSTSSVRFTVGSPAINNGFSNTPETPLNPPVRKYSMPATSSTSRLVSDRTDSERAQLVKNVLESVYTPKRVQPRVLAQHSKSKKTGDGNSHRAVITSEFVEWCSRIFLNPILDVINGNNNEDENGERQIPNVIPTDWAFHTREGLYQKSAEEFVTLKKNQVLDTSLVSIENPGIKYMAISYLRKVLYMCDGLELSTLRFEASKANATKPFSLIGANPYTDADQTCSLKVINEMSREMLLCGSKKGIIRIWDLHYDVHSHHIDPLRKEPTLVACAMPLYYELERNPTDMIEEYSTKDNERKASITSNISRIGFNKGVTRRTKQYDCFYEWHQDSGRLVCAGNSRIVKIWSAHTEKTVADVMVGNRCGRVTALTTTLNDPQDERMIAVGFRNGAVHIHDLRAIDTKYAVLKHEDTPDPVVGCNFEGTTCTVVNQQGRILSLDLRMYTDPFNVYNLGGADEVHSVEWHSNHMELMACITRSFAVSNEGKLACKLYDVKNKKSFGTLGGAQNNVKSVAWHKMRAMVAVADENRVALYGFK